jgi:integrase
MNANRTMQSKVAAYLAERRREGFGMKISGQQLSWFAQFTDSTGYRGPLTIELASRWALANRGGRRLTAARRIEVLRPFAQYCRGWDQRSEVPPLHLFGPGHRRMTPHIYRDSEVQALIGAARALHPSGRLRAETCATIIGLIAACGLRISEVTSLSRHDVDLETGCLHIRHGKFGKSRLVPLHSSTAKALRHYASQRDRDPRCVDGDSFFMFDRGRAAGTRQIQYAFKTVRKILPSRPRGGHSRYRLHDLRHTFVCRRIERWYRQGVDVDCKILALSTYIGHVSPADTYWYVTATPRLLALAASRLAPLAVGGVV